MTIPDTKDIVGANKTSAAEINQLATIHGSNERHARPHTGEKPYACEDVGCGKRFYTQKQLKEHKTVRPKKYACSDCSKTFDRPYKLTRHARTHTGYKPYACKAAGCSKAYYSRDELIRHTRHFCKSNPERFNDDRRTHTEEKLDACEITDCSSRPDRPAGSNPHNSDVKMYGSTKYERMAKGPFLGKVASRRIITINGKKYIEHSVLLKPSFY